MALHDSDCKLRLFLAKTKLLNFLIAYVCLVAG